MMRVDDLVAAIAALQRSDLEDWIREELIVRGRKPENGFSPTWNMHASASSPRCTMNSRLGLKGASSMWA